MPSRADATTVLVMNGTNHPQMFLDHLAVRDFDGLASAIAPDAHARLMLPRGPEEHLGGTEIVNRISGWIASASQFEVLSMSDEAIGERRRLSWRFRVVRESGSPEIVEQLAYVNVGPDRVVFDAGSLGCADGLAQEFRHRIETVPVGASLVVVVADPAAKADLPPLARMLGHTVKSTQTLDDGRLTLTVERNK